MVGCGGIFNEILTLENKEGGSQHQEHQMDIFHDCLDHCCLRPLPFQGVGADHLGFIKSDHRALRISLASSSQDGIGLATRRSRFRFEALWLEDEESYKVVDDHWNIVPSFDSISNVISNLQSCFIALTDWHIKKFGSMRRDIQKAQWK
ncbi:hypothetical protein TorRG33x02_340010 [Trema orientale]|uniref:Endonuclease/exonuclease/phosphatase n=1 Tax=Trema orientale TaxID=63057 RepID=A0A2P5AVT7_TREOI|nr:hypothetical protein TorRG33x02_340010 [Trema orientale]